MTVKDNIMNALKTHSSSIVLSRDFSSFGSSTQVTRAIKDLVSSGFLLKIGIGIYENKKYSIEKNSDINTVVRDIFHKLNKKIESIKIETIVDKKICIVNIGSQNISRKLEIHNIPVHYIKSNTKYENDDFSALLNDVNNLPVKGVRKFIEHLAAAHGVKYKRTSLDDFAESVTRLAGDEIELDYTEKLLVALKKKDLITARQLARLMTNYMEEVKNVRSVRGL